MEIGSALTTEANSKLAPVYLEEVLMEDPTEGFGITQNKLAVAISAPPGHINEVVHGQCAVTADTVLRLGKCSGALVQFWLDPQARYDFDAVGDRLSMQTDAITPPWVA